MLDEKKMEGRLTRDRHRDDGCSRRFETRFDLSVGHEENEKVGNSLAG